jgi:membrane protein required for colicin V production
MQGADYVIVAVVGISVVLGIFRGFVREAVALLAWLIGVWVAWRHSDFVHPYLGGLIESPTQKAWAARAIVLLGVLLAGALIGAILAWVTHTAAGLSVLDRLLGMLFGLTRGVVIVGLATLLGLTLRLQTESWWTSSKLMPYAVYVGDWLQGFGGETRELAKRALGADAPRTRAAARQG